MGHVRDELVHAWPGDGPVGGALDARVDCGTRASVEWRVGAVGVDQQFGSRWVRTKTRSGSENELAPRGDAQMVLAAVVPDHQFAPALEQRAAI